MSLIQKVLLQQSSLVINQCNKALAAVQLRNYAARKGTRERKAKKKVKVEVEKIGFIPHNQRDRERFLLTRPKRKFDDSWKQLPVDNVYPFRYYQWPVYPFKEIVQNLRDLNHPEIYNRPTDKLCVSIELNMETEKKNKYVDNFSRITPMPYAFDHGEERNIIVFTKNENIVQECRDAGAQLVGGVELIKQIQNGAISLTDFNFILSDPAILPDLVILKGVMKKQFPNIKSGTLDANLPELIKKFLNGLSYFGRKDEFEKDFGLVETFIGTINMDIKHLEENFTSLIHDVYATKPKKSEMFIRRCLLSCPGIRKKFKVDYKAYLKDEEDIQDDGKENKNEQQALAI